MPSSMRSAQLHAKCPAPCDRDACTLWHVRSLPVKLPYQSDHSVGGSGLRPRQVLKRSKHGEAPLAQRVQPYAGASVSGCQSASFGFVGQAKRVGKTLVSRLRYRFCLWVNKLAFRVYLCHATANCLQDLRRIRGVRLVSAFRISKEVPGA